MFSPCVGVCVISFFCKGECLMELLGLSWWPCRRGSTSDTRWCLRCNQSQHKHITTVKIPYSFLDFFFAGLCFDFSIRKGRKSCFRNQLSGQDHMQTHTSTITQANLRVDNITEIRVLWCSKMKHKSRDREKTRNTAVSMMGTNGQVMSGEVSYKYLSLYYVGYLPWKAGLLIFEVNDSVWAF